MALKHAQPLDVIALHSAGLGDGNSTSTSLLKVPRMQLMRLSLKSGQCVPEHKAPGEVTIQCLSGQADVLTPARTCHLTPATLVMLPAAEPHAVRANEDTVLLVTLLL